MVLAEFGKYCEKRQQEVGTRITQLTANKYHRLLRYMTEYIRQMYGKEDLPLEAVDYAYVDGLNTYMQTACNCHNNGAVNLLCCLKNFLLYAIRNEWIEKNPFRLLQDEDRQDECQGAADEGGTGSAVEAADAQRASGPDSGRLLLLRADGIGLHGCRPPAAGTLHNGRGGTTVDP